MNLHVNDLDFNDLDVNDLDANHCLDANTYERAKFAI